MSRQVHAGGPEADSARRAATRRRLLDAASDVFVSDGLQGATVEEITERAGFTRGAFYSNFDSKEQLFLALTDRNARCVLADLAQWAARPDAFAEIDPDADEAELADLLADRLTDVLDAVGDRQWSVLQEEFWLAAVRDRALAEQFLASRTALMAAVQQVVGQLLAKVGRGFAVDPELACRILVVIYLESSRDAALAGRDGVIDAALRLTFVKIVLALTRPLG